MGLRATLLNHIPACSSEFPRECIFNPSNLICFSEKCQSRTISRASDEDNVRRDVGDGDGDDIGEVDNENNVNEETEVTKETVFHTLSINLAVDDKIAPVTSL